MDDMTAERERREMMLSIQHALTSPETRTLLRWVLQRTGMFDPAFTGNSTTFYNEGRRDVGLEIVAMLNEIDPYEFVRLMKEGVDATVLKRNAEKTGEGHAD